MGDEGIVSELKALNEKADTIIGIMQRPANRFLRILEIAGTIIAVLSGLSIVEVVRQWLGL